MSKLAEVCELEKKYVEQLLALEALQSDAGLKREIEFESKLRALLGEYSYSLKDIINLLNPQSGRRVSPAKFKRGNRKPRHLKVYKNPHTGEVLETKGGNHKELKKWKATHGSDTIKSWIVK